MPDQRNAGAVYDYVVAGCEQIIFIMPGLKQCKFEQRTIEWHRRALDRCCYRARFFHGMARVAQVIKGQLDVWVIDRTLENLAILLKEGDPHGLGLSHSAPNRPLKAVAFYWAVNFYEKSKLPLGSGVTGFLREPYV